MMLAIGIPRGEKMQQHREAAISVRAHELWVESGHAHGQDEQHWHQAEREMAEAEARSAAVEQFAAETMDVAPAKPSRKKATKTASPKAVEAAPTFARKVRTPKQATASASMN